MNNLIPTDITGLISLSIATVNRSCATAISVLRNGKESFHLEESEAIFKYRSLTPGNELVVDLVMTHRVPVQMRKRIIRWSSLLVKMTG